jgi:rare lipoprotein A
VRIEVVEQQPLASPVPPATNPQAGLVPVMQGSASPAPQEGPLTYLQVGAFSKSESADSLRTRLAPTVNGKVLVRPEPNRNLFKVLVGPILDNVELLTLRQKLADAQLPNAHLVEY